MPSIYEPAPTAEDQAYVDFIRLFRQMLHASIETPDLILLNIYVDPSHVVSFEGFHQMREMLVDGQGNFGSVDGDSTAAMRYTECKLRPLAV